MEFKLGEDCWDIKDQSIFVFEKTAARRLKVKVLLIFKVKVLLLLKNVQGTSKNTRTEVQYCRKDYIVILNDYSRIVRDNYLSITIMM